MLLRELQTQTAGGLNTNLGPFACSLASLSLVLSLTGSLSLCLSFHTFLTLVLCSQMPPSKYKQLSCFLSIYNSCADVLFLKFFFIHVLIQQYSSLEVRKKAMQEKCYKFQTTNNIIGYSLPSIITIVLPFLTLLTSLLLLTHLSCHHLYIFHTYSY